MMLVLDLSVTSLAAGVQAGPTVQFHSGPQKLLYSKAATETLLYWVTHSLQHTM